MAGHYAVFMLLHIEFDLRFSRAENLVEIDFGNGLPFPLEVIVDTVLQRMGGTKAGQRTPDEFSGAEADTAKDAGSIDAH
jgi:hypothetical protein